MCDLIIVGHITVKYVLLSLNVVNFKAFNDYSSAYSYVNLTFKWFKILENMEVNGNHEMCDKTKTIVVIILNYSKFFCRLTFSLH